MLCTMIYSKGYDWTSCVIQSNYPLKYCLRIYKMRGSNKYKSIVSYLSPELKRVWMNALSCGVFAGPVLQFVHEGASGLRGEACKYATSY